jgi:GNAT superfamily N-acetyltransferase
VLPDGPLEAHRARIAGWLADPAVAIWVAEDDGELIGMVQVNPADGLIEDGIRPEHGAYLYEGHVTARWRGQGVGVALVERAMTWAREAGFTACVVDWFTANPLSSRFWPGRGFVPFAGQLARRIDPRTVQPGG